MAKKETNFLKTKRLCDLRAECSAETSLPDYNTDVRKILHVKASPHPISSFASADGIECSGEVAFDVVYLDFEGEVSSASFSGDYGFTVKCDTENYKDSLVETSLGALSLRLMSPRKIAARATLESSVTLITEEAVTVEGDALEAELNPEIRSDMHNLRTTAITPAAEREYGVSLARFEGKTTDEVSLLHLSVTPVVERIVAEDGEAELVGRINAVALVKTDEYPLHKIEKSLEISEKLPLGDMDPESDLRAALEVVSATAVTEGDEGGVQMTLSIITESRLVGEKNTAAELYSDVYLCEYPCECISDSFGYEEYLGRWSASREISESIPFTGLGAGKLREVIYADADVKVNGKELTAEGAVIDGEISVSAIATEINDDDGVEFIPLKFSVKFKENINCDCQIDDKTAFEEHVSLAGLSVTVDSSSVYFKSELGLEASLFSHREAEVLRSAKALFSEPYKKNPSRVSVYYPMEGDTLYSVAKAYHTTKEKLLRDNPKAAETVSAKGEISPALARLIIT